jgi:hypothetical protein
MFCRESGHNERPTETFDGSEDYPAYPDRRRQGRERLILLLDVFSSSVAKTNPETHLNSSDGLLADQVRANLTSRT